MSRTTKLGLAVGVLFGILFYFQWLSPLGLDDITFKNLLYEPERILDFAVKQYLTWDGRITGYLLNLSVLYVPRLAADIFLALTPLGLILTMLMHALGPDWKQRITWRHLAGAFCLLWLSIPDFGQVFFWKTGSPYSIIPMLYLLLLWPYRLWAERGRYQAGTFCALLPLAVVCGLADFHNTLAVALLLLAVNAWQAWRGQRRLAAWLPPLTLVICFAVIYWAPGNAIRIQTTMPEFLERSRWTYILAHLGNQGTVQSYYLWEYLLLAVSGWLLWRQGAGAAPDAAPAGLCARLKPWVTALAVAPALAVAMVFFLLAQAVQLVFMFAPMAEPRVFTSSVIFMIVAALAVAQQALDRLGAEGRKTRLWRLVWVPAGLVCVFNLGMAAVMYHETHVYIVGTERVLAAAKPEDRVQVPPCPYQSGRYLFHGVNFGVQDGKCWGNRQLARYYNVASIRLTPQRFTLLPEDKATRFDGRAEKSVLAFSYKPSPANAGLPFVFAFPPVPKDLARKYGQDLAGRYLRGTCLFPRFIQAAYTLCKPEIRTDGRAGGGVIAGSLELPRLEQTDQGYIAHLDPRNGDIRSLVPLRIVRKN